MKMLTRRINAILRCKKGETIVESLVSIVLLVILLAAVTTMIQTALNMTSRSIQNAKENQEVIINPLIKSVSDGETKITFSYSYEVDGTSKDCRAEHEVKTYDKDGVKAFSPLYEVSAPDGYDAGGG